VSVRFTPVAVVSIAASVALLAGGPALAATKPNAVRPNQVKGCTPGQSFAVTSLGYQTLGIPSIFSEVWNKGTTATTLTLGKTGSSATTYGISATESVDAGIIFAKVGASSTQSISYTHTTGYTASASVVTPAHEYGWVGAGTKYVDGNGTDTILYGNCDTTKVPVTLFRFPETNSGDDYITDTTKTDLAAPPWTMAP
jgi:hypothetical protein